MKRCSQSLLALLIMLATQLSAAHPLGNNTINRAAILSVGSEQIRVRYVLDLAEIPTLLAGQQADSDGDGTTTNQEWQTYAQDQANLAAAGIRLTANGHSLVLAADTVRWERLPGAADLHTLRIDASLSAALPALRSPIDIRYRDERRPDEAGWQEVVATATTAVELLALDVPGESASAILTKFPANTELPRVLSAAIVAQPLTGAAESAAVGPAVSAGPSIGATKSTAHAAPLALWSFFRLGIHHIATGWDHLVFLLGLVVAHRELRRLVWVVSAFTVAHSLTLGLAASGLVHAPGAWVEPAIALTIAYVGLANLFGLRRHGAALAFGFGLIHGLGFAGALADSLAGTTIGGHGWLLELAAFNVGIETFQLALIAVLVPTLNCLRATRWSVPVLRLTSVMILLAGVGWFLTRVPAMVAG